MGLIQSMSRKGKCHDNAPIESFFNLLKREWLNRIKIDSVAQLEAEVKDYANWYNNERISAKINGLCPVEFREKALLAS